MEKADSSKGFNRQLCSGDSKKLFEKNFPNEYLITINITTYETERDTVILLSVWILYYVSNMESRSTYINGLAKYKELTKGLDSPGVKE